MAVRQRSLDKLRERLAAIDAKIARLSNVIEPPPVNLHARRSGKGDTPRAIFDLLRETGGPVTAEMVAARLMARYALPTDDPVVRYAMRQRAGQILRRCERRGLLVGARRQGRHGFKAWVLSATTGDTGS